MIEPNAALDDRSRSATILQTRCPSSEDVLTRTRLGIVQHTTEFYILHLNSSLCYPRIVLPSRTSWACDVMGMWWEWGFVTRRKFYINDLIVGLGFNVEGSNCLPRWLKDSSLGPWGVFLIIELLYGISVKEGKEISIHHREHEYEKWRDLAI